MKVLKAAKMRMEAGDASLRDTVAVLIDRVRKEGDEALKEFGRRFDGCERETFRVSPAEIQEAYDALTPEEIADLRAAAANIEAFAKAQKGSLCELKDFSPAPGIFLGHRIIPVDSCCCYVPGGGYPLYSTALMLGIPAKAAGVKRDSCSTSGWGSRGHSAMMRLRRSVSWVKRRPSAMRPEAVRKYWARFITTPSLRRFSMWSGPVRRATKMRLAEVTPTPGMRSSVS